MKIRTKITFSLLAVSAIAVVLVSITSFYFAKNQLLAAHGLHLLAVASGQKNYLTHVLQAWHNDIALITSRTQLRRTFTEHLKKPDKKHTDMIREILLDAVNASPFIKKISICNSDGETILTVGNSNFIPLKCEKLTKQEISEAKIMGLWMNEKGDLYTLITGPLSFENNIIGSVYALISAHEILSITQNYTGLGKTGEVVIAERTSEGHARFLTPLRYDPNLGLERIVKVNQVNVPITYALLGKKQELITPETIDYRNKSVLAATAYIPEMDWGMVAKIDRNEALKPIVNLFISICFSALIVFLLIMGIGLSMGHAITKPILQFVEILQKAREGNLEQKLKINSGDEIGYLAESFNNMLESLRKKTEQVVQSEERYEIAVKGSSVGLWDWNPETGVLFWSERFKEMMCVSNEEFKDTFEDFSDRLHPEDRDKTLKAYFEHIENKKPYNVEYRLMRGDGSYIWLHARGQAIWNNEGKMLRVAGSADDITDQKHAEEELLRSNEELERFAYIASHDLQEPLRMVSNFTGLLNEEYGAKLDKQGRQYMNFVIEASNRMHELISDLLEYSRVGQEDTGFETFNSQESIDNAINNLGEAIEETGAMIKIDKMPIVHANPLRFSRLIQNLLGNSIKYRAKHRKLKIHIGVKDLNDEWLFFIKDNGIGIKEKYIKQIFIIFKRLHNKSAYTGTGIGLAVCNKIVDSFGGQLWAESNFGKGSIFYFTVPKHEEKGT